MRCLGNFWGCNLKQTFEVSLPTFTLKNNTKKGKVQAATKKFIYQLFRPLLQRKITLISIITTNLASNSNYHRFYIYTAL